MHSHWFGIHAEHPWLQTAIVVSHRLSVLARADRVLVLEGGRLVDCGPHSELIGRPGGAYRRAWDLQQAADRLTALDEGDDD